MRYMALLKGNRESESSVPSKEDLEAYESGDFGLETAA